MLIKARGDADPLIFKNNVSLRVTATPSEY